MFSMVYRDTQNPRFRQTDLDSFSAVTPWLHSCAVEPLPLTIWRRWSGKRKANAMTNGNDNHRNNPHTTAAPAAETCKDKRGKDNHFQNVAKNMQQKTESMSWTNFPELTGLQGLQVGLYVRSLDWKPMKGTPYDSVPTQQELAHWSGFCFCLIMFPDWPLQQANPPKLFHHFSLCIEGGGLNIEIWKVWRCRRNCGWDVHLRRWRFATVLLDIFNRMIVSNAFDSVVPHCLHMLPKIGDSSKPSSCRPIPVLKIYIIHFFGVGLLLNRLAPFYANEQPANQFGFRQGRGINDAMVVLENDSGNFLFVSLKCGLPTLLSKKFSTTSNMIPCFRHCKRKKFQT